MHTSLAIAIWVFQAIGTVLCIGVTFIVPLALIGYMMYGVEVVCLQAYKHWYRLTCVMDFIFPPSWRHPVRFVILYSPALVVGGAFMLSFGVKGYHAIWDEDPKALPVVDAGTTIKRYKITAMKPPKGFYVSIKALDGSEEQLDHYVSSYCDGYERLHVGDEVNLKTHYTKQGEHNYVEFPDIYGVLCAN